MVATGGQTGRKQEGGRVAKRFYVIYGNYVMSAQQLLEVSQLGVGTALRLERDVWSMVK